MFVMHKPCLHKKQQQQQQQHNTIHKTIRKLYFNFWIRFNVCKPDVLSTKPSFMLLFLQGLLKGVIVKGSVVHTIMMVRYENDCSIWLLSYYWNNSNSEPVNECLWMTNLMGYRYSRLATELTIPMVSVRSWDSCTRWSCPYPLVSDQNQN